VEFRLKKENKFTAILSGEACLQVDGIRSIFLWISTFTLFLDLKVIGVGVSRYRYMRVCVCVCVCFYGHHYLPCPIINAFDICNSARLELLFAARQTHSLLFLLLELQQTTV
jgi:hypothetical protein